MKRKVNYGRLATLILLAAGFIALGIGLIAGAAGSRQPVTKDEAQAEPETSKSVAVTATGDILLEAPLIEQFGTGSWNDLLTGVEPWLSGDDLTIANMEVPIGGEELGITGIDYNFNSYKETAANLKSNSIEFVSLANNHAYDRGSQGIANTHANLDEAGVGYTGTATSQEERDAVKTVDVNGMKIAIVSWTYNTNQPVEQDYEVNAFYNCDSPQVQTLLDDVQKARSSADAVIVCMHWGTEFTYELNQDQVVLSQQIADAGADVIIGNHPHTVQPAATLTASDGRQVPCFYSLGNLVSSAYMVDRADEQFQDMYEVGALAQFELTEEDETVKVSDVRLIPYVIQFEGEYEHPRLIALKDYTEELAAAHTQRQYSTLFTKEWITDQLHQVFDDSGFELVTQ